MSPTKQPSSSAAKETAEVVKLVVEQEVATVRSTLGRRMSKKEVLVRQHLEPQLGDLKNLKRNLPSDVSHACLSSVASLSEV